MLWWEYKQNITPVLSFNFTVKKIRINSITQSRAKHFCFLFKQLPHGDPSAGWGSASGKLLGGQLGKPGSQPDPGFPSVSGRARLLSLRWTQAFARHRFHFFPVCHWTWPSLSMRAFQSFFSLGRFSSFPPPPRPPSPDLSCAACWPSVSALPSHAKALMEDLAGTSSFFTPKNFLCSQISSSFQLQSFFFFFFLFVSIQHLSNITENTK